ncbi:MAG: hypothetical protein K8Q89_05810 [Nitrosarchaeum sp.]|nr:hypothetical protein [Nitrosarchaeum sp.]
MGIKTKYIWGCIHENRNILSTTTFERGLEIPAAFCENCIPVCDICLKKIKTKTYDKLELCEKCYLRVIKISKN